MHFEDVWNRSVRFTQERFEHVELFYKLYNRTPVTTKYMCVVVKRGLNDVFVVTAYFTNAVKVESRGGAVG